MKTKDLYGLLGNLMKRPKTRDDYWYNKVANAEPKKIYRECPRCGMKTGIPEIYKTQWCFMCGETIYADEELNEKAKKKCEFIRKLKGKGIDINDKKNIRGKKVQKEI